MNSIKGFLCCFGLLFLCLLVAGSWGCLKEPEFYMTDEEKAESIVIRKLEMLQNNENY